jgi:hypothetical protein
MRYILIYIFDCFIHHFILFIAGCFFKLTANGHLQVVVADFEERQCPLGHDGQKGAETTHTTAPAMQFAICYGQLFIIQSFIG